MKRKPPNHRERGLVLVTTIFLLAMFAILVVGFLDSMSEESAASDRIESAQRAKLVAQGAVAHAIDILRTNIPDPAKISEGAGPVSLDQARFSEGSREAPRPFEIGRADIEYAPAELWVTNPGRLTLVSESGQHEYISLHSGEVKGVGRKDPDLFSFDLNSPVAGETEPAITPAGDGGSSTPSMRVRFVNVLDDPSRSPSKENAIVGRYAFWLDDETAKLNFNVASGKPSREEDERFHRMLKGGMVTPYFWRGTGETRRDSGGRRPWSLGHPRSVNLDVLFRTRNQIDRNDLLDHSWVHGFHRYPEAILSYLTMGSDADERQWYARNRFQLTFYSRGPEFNPFGRSRFFTTHHPLSLEAGPYYQQVFMYDPKGAKILNLNALMGAFGTPGGTMVPDGRGGMVSAGSMINRWQLEMLMRYMYREWPGYGFSFVDKYGEAGCVQICLNLLNMARFSTTGMNEARISQFSQDWAARTTSVSYGPNEGEMRYDEQGENHRHLMAPERFYWRFKIPGVEGKGRDGEVLMIPQSPGPHITEIGVEFRARTPNRSHHVRDTPMTLTKTSENPEGRLPDNTLPRLLEYRFVSEYYMHPFGPVLQMDRFRTMVDYLDLQVSGSGLSQVGAADFKDDARVHLGIYDELGARSTTDWTKSTAGGRLRGIAGGGQYIAGKEMGLSYGSPSMRTPLNRVRVNGPWRPVGERSFQVPAYWQDEGGTMNYRQWRPVLFDAAKKSKVTIEDLQFRAGMTVSNNSQQRPRQMIPLGERDEDVLKFPRKLEINLLEAGVQAGVFWEIADPNLSAHADQWVLNPDTSPGSHSLGRLNEAAGEPGEADPEKSKFKYIQRSVYWSRWKRWINAYRGDEYWSKGRLTSKGFWSFLHTGMESKDQWRTLSLEGAARQASPPDWLLLELLGATYPMQHDQWINDKSLPDEFSTVSFMNSTMGQVNVNSRIYPQNKYFNPPARTKPLEGVFKHLRKDESVKKFVQSLVAHQEDDEVFEYIGEISNVRGYGDNARSQFERENLLRNMAGCLTTNSNTFGMWGVAQMVKKARSNDDYGTFEEGDSVTGEKRFFALLERYVWPGKDGIPGNAHVNRKGVWDRIAKQESKFKKTDRFTDRLYLLPGSPPLKRGPQNGDVPRLVIDNKGTFPEYDGPQPVGMDPFTENRLGKVVYKATPLEEAYNPPQPVVKYRVVYFRYIDE